MWIRQNRPMEPDVSGQIIIQHKPPLSWCCHWRPMTTPVSLQHESFWFCVSVILLLKDFYNACIWKSTNSSEKQQLLCDSFILWSNHSQPPQMLRRWYCFLKTISPCRRCSAEPTREEAFSVETLNPCIMCKCNMWWLYHPLFQHHKDPFIFCLLGWE